MLRSLRVKINFHSLALFCKEKNKAFMGKRSLLFLINPKSGVSNKRSIPKLIESCIDKDKFDYAIAETKYRLFIFIDKLLYIKSPPLYNIIRR